MIISAIGKLKKKTSRGFDAIPAQHLSLCGEVLTEYSNLIYQMMFNLRCVLDSFLIGPIYKKNKPPPEPSYFPPITVETLFCKIFENLIIDEL